MRKMKDSGVPWIGEIPEGWEVCQLGKMIRLSSGQALSAEKIESESGEFAVWGGNGLRGYTNSYFLHGEYILIGRQGAQCGNIHIASGYFWVTEHALIVYEIFPLNKHWLSYVLTSMDLNKYSTSAAQPGLSAEQIRKLFFCVPASGEQNSIADYLDTQCARIDATIANIRSLIAKLKEYKQSVITEAVTKGLDPDVPMKDSGVPWIGKVPEGWQVCPLKWRVHFVKTGGTPAGAQDIFYADDGFPWFTPSDFGDSLRISESAKKLSDLGIKEVKIFPKNCVLMIGIGATMGKVALSSCDCSANQQINSIVCDDKLFPLFLTFFLKTITDYLFKCGKFTTLPILNQEETKSIIVPVPSFAEQQRIADYLDTQCAKIDTALARQEELLTKLEAYKKSLIYECVTGKREVPASA